MTSPSPRQKTSSSAAHEHGSRPLSCVRNFRPLSYRPHRLRQSNRAPGRRSNRGSPSAPTPAALPLGACWRQRSFSWSKSALLTRRPAARTSPRAAGCTGLLSPLATPQCSAPRACCGCAKRRSAEQLSPTSHRRSGASSAATSPSGSRPSRRWRCRLRHWWYWAARPLGCLRVESRCCALPCLPRESRPLPPLSRP